MEVQPDHTSARRFPRRGRGGRWIDAGVLCALLAVVVTPGASYALPSSQHPRLLFTEQELPELRARVHDGGHADHAYQVVHTLVRDTYANETASQMYGSGFSAGAVGVMPDLVLAAWLEDPIDTLAVRTGRRLLFYIADSLEVDDNVYFAPLRLKALAIGYDGLFDFMSSSERLRVRGEMEAYVDTMLTTFAYDLFNYRPFVYNISAMIASSLGLAAIALDGDTNPARVTSTLAFADTMVAEWLRYQVDPGGAYNEGAMYAGWSMRQLVYYFWARKRYDGYDYAAIDRVRNMERWIAYSMLPIGPAEVNNLNDTATLNYPWSRHNTYFEWAQTAWNSSLSSWIWDRLMGPVYGHDSGPLADHAATVLWNRSLPPTPPGDVLPDHVLFKHRGLYYFRNGWPQGLVSPEVVFSFYSGKFQGGHAQEDQNQFTLYGYGERWAVDNGFLRPPAETEAHNLTLIDGRGQHNAGGTMGTDGRIAEYLLADVADYIMGDATQAYTTHSHFNDPDVPYPGMDWSQGYDGGNPVEYAFRRFVVVHGPGMPPYVVLTEDIRKDDSLRVYEWRMHTDEAHTVDLSANPIRITGTSGAMDLYTVSPAFDSLTTSLGHFDNGNEDPNTTILRLSIVSRGPRFIFLFLPRAAAMTPPVVSYDRAGALLEATVSWDGLTDRLLWNDGADTVVTQTPEGPVATDARFLFVRRSGGGVQYLGRAVSVLDVGSVPYVRTSAPVEVASSGTAIDLDRDDVQFRFYGPDVRQVRYRGQPLPVVFDGDFVTNADTSGVSSRPPSPIVVRVAPNPFAAGATVTVSSLGNGPVTVSVFDVAGRRVRTLWNAPLAPGSTTLRVDWDGRDARGRRVASGVYFVHARSTLGSATTRALLLK